MSRSDLMVQSENQQNFSQRQFLQHQNLKINVSNCYICENLFHQSFLDIEIIYGGCRYIVGSFTIWSYSVKIYKSLFGDTFKKQ